MKKILLAFAFLPMLSFAQESSANIKNINKLHRSSQSITAYENSRPAFFIEGKQVSESFFSKTDTALIDKIVIVKTDKNYPNGKIDLFLKKIKE